jgi:hypothetical protein
MPLAEQVNAELPKAVPSFFTRLVGGYSANVLDASGYAPKTLCGDALQWRSDSDQSATITRCLPTLGSCPPITSVLDQKRGAWSGLVEDGVADWRV